jgi:hypothetical protein
LKNMWRRRCRSRAQRSRGCSLTDAPALRFPDKLAEPDPDGPAPARRPRGPCARPTPTWAPTNAKRRLRGSAVRVLDREAGYFSSLASRSLTFARMFRARWRSGCFDAPTRASSRQPLRARDTPPKPCSDAQRALRAAGGDEESGAARHWSRALSSLRAAGLHPCHRGRDPTHVGRRPSGARLAGGMRRCHPRHRG